MSAAEDAAEQMRVLAKDLGLNTGPLSDEPPADMTFHFRWGYQYWPSILEHTLSYVQKPGYTVDIHFVDVHLTVRPDTQEGIEKLVQAYYDI